MNTTKLLNFIEIYRKKRQHLFTKTPISAIAYW